MKTDHYFPDSHNSHLYLIPVEHRAEWVEWQQQFYTYGVDPTPVVPGFARLVDVTDILTFVE